MGNQSSDPPDELRSCYAKLLRAWKHLDDLKTSVEDWRQPHPYELVREDQPETDNYIDYIFRVKILRRQPLDWSIVIGEVLYNIHSALDHLANRLAERNGISQRVTFPIFKNRSKFWRKDKDGTYNARSGAARLMLMPDDAHPLVEAVQPYQRGNDAPRHPLWLLHELSNADKHHALHLVGAAIVGTRLEAWPRHDVLPEQRWINLGPFDDNDEIGLIRLWKTGPDPKATVKTQFATTEAFAETGPAPGENPANVLFEILVYVLNEVFDQRFGPYFSR